MHWLKKTEPGSKKGLDQDGYSKLKALIRKVAARTYEELWQAVGHVCSLFTPKECYNFFKAAGYETN